MRCLNKCWNLLLFLVFICFSLALQAEPVDGPPTREFSQHIQMPGGDFVFVGLVFPSKKPGYVEIKLIAYWNGKRLNSSLKKTLKSCAKHDDFKPDKLSFQILKGGEEGGGVYLQTGKKCKPKKNPIYEVTLFAPEYISPKEESSIKEDKEKEKRTAAEKLKKNKEKPPWKIKHYTFHSYKPVSIKSYKGQTLPGKIDKGVGFWGFEKEDPLPDYKKPLLKPVVHVWYPHEKKALFQKGDMPNDVAAWGQKKSDRTPLGDFFSSLTELKIKRIIGLIDDVLADEEAKTWLSKKGLPTKKEELLSFVKKNLGDLQKFAEEKLIKLPVTLKLDIKKGDAENVKRAGAT